MLANILTYICLKYMSYYDKRLLTNRCFDPSLVTHNQGRLKFESYLKEYFLVSKPPNENALTLGTGQSEK